MRSNFSTVNGLVRRYIHFKTMLISYFRIVDGCLQEKRLAEQTETQRRLLKKIESTKNENLNLIESLKYARNKTENELLTKIQSQVEPTMMKSDYVLQQLNSRSSCNSFQSIFL